MVQAQRTGACRIVVCGCAVSSDDWAYLCRLQTSPLMQERYPNNPRIMRAYSRFLQQVGLREAQPSGRCKQQAACHHRGALIADCQPCKAVARVMCSFPGEERPPRLGALWCLCKAHRAAPGALAEGETWCGCSTAL